MHRELFSIAGYSIYSYGFMMFIGICLGCYMIYRIGRERNMDVQVLLEYTSNGIIIGLLSARIGHILQYWHHYEDNLWGIFNLREGGMSLVPGMIGGSIYYAWICYRQKAPFMNMLDIIAAPGLLGMAMGRVGCFLNGCCYGNQCELAWAVTYPIETGILGARHPSQLYEFTFDILFMLLALWKLRHLQFAGQSFFIAIGGYASIRFFTEFIRADTFEPIGILTGYQWFSIVVVTLCTLGYFGKLLRQPVDYSWTTEDNKDN